MYILEFVIFYLGFVSLGIFNIAVGFEKNLQNYLKIVLLFLSSTLYVYLKPIMAMEQMILVFTVFMFLVLLVESVSLGGEIEKNKGKKTKTKIASWMRFTLSLLLVLVSAAYSVGLLKSIFF